MFMVVQFYIQLKNDVAEHNPGIKVLSIKLVIFFSFWQTVGLKTLGLEMMTIANLFSRWSYRSLPQQMDLSNPLLNSATKTSRLESHPSY